MLTFLLNRFSKLMFDFSINPFFGICCLRRQTKKDQIPFQQPPVPIRRPLAEFGIQPHFTAAQQTPHMPYFSVPPARAFCHSFKQVCQCVNRNDEGQPALSTIYVPMQVNQLWFDTLEAFDFSKLRLLHSAARPNLAHMYNHHF